MEGGAGAGADDDEDDEAMYFSRDELAGLRRRVRHACEDLLRDRYLYLSIVRRYLAVRLPNVLVTISIILYHCFMSLYSSC